jgi:hypothetical protein
LFELFGHAIHFNFWLGLEELPELQPGSVSAMRVMSVGAEIEIQA